jgi:hypothetical protein
VVKHGIELKIIQPNQGSITVGEPIIPVVNEENTSNEEETTIKPNNYIIDKARNYFNVLKKYNLNKEKDFTAQAISLHFLETNSGLPIEKMALKILDAERLNQFGLDPNIELSLSATMMRFMLNVINLIMKLADKKKIAPGSFIDRMIISVKKLRIILSFEYSKKTKGRCQRITDLLRGTAKKFGSSVIKRKGLKDDYRLDSFVKFMETDGEPTPRLYEDMKSDCNKKKGFLTRTRCSRLVKARQNFDRYVNKHCEPRRNKTLIGGKKGIKHKAKTLKKIQTGGDADDALIYLSVGAIIIVCFVMGIVLMNQSVLDGNRGNTKYATNKAVGGSFLFIFSILLIFMLFSAGD